MNSKTQDRQSFLTNIAYFAVIAGLVYLVFKYLIGWLLPFLLAFLIVSIINPIIRFVKRKLKIEREIISLIIMILTYAIVIFLLIILITQLVIWLQSAFAGLPSYYENYLYPTLTTAGNNISIFLNNLPDSWRVGFSDIQGEVMSTIRNMLLSISQKGISALSGITSGIPQFLFTFLFTLMLSFFISMQYSKVTAFIHRVAPKKVSKLLVDIKKAFLQTIGKYLRASLTLMAITAVELFIGFSIIGAKNTIGLALIIAVFDALPFFGTGTVMVPWVIIELIQGNYPFALGLLIIYGSVTIIRNIIEPKIISDKLGLNPIVSLSAIYFGFRTIGVLGMILTPITVQILIALHKSGSISIFKNIMNDKDIPLAEQTLPDKKDDTADPSS